MWFTYILKSIGNEWYYVGSTNRLNIRLLEHNNGKVKSTKHYKPFEIIYKKEFTIEKEARDYERKLKKCRVEKENIIRKYRSGIV